MVSSFFSVFALKLKFSILISENSPSNSAYLSYNWEMVDWSLDTFCSSWGSMTGVGSGLWLVLELNASPFRLVKSCFSYLIWRSTSAPWSRRSLYCFFIVLIFCSFSISLLEFESIRVFNSSWETPNSWTLNRVSFCWDETSIRSYWSIWIVSNLASSRPVLTFLSTSLLSFWRSWCTLSCVT